MPPNLGEDYTTKFQAVFPEVAREQNATLLPFLLDGVGGIPELLPAADLVPAGDAAALARAIGDVLRDGERRARMSAGNFDVARRYREDLLAAERRGFYDELRRVSTPSRASAR